MSPTITCSTLKVLLMLPLDVSLENTEEPNIPSYFLSYKVKKMNNFVHSGFDLWFC